MKGIWAIIGIGAAALIPLTNTAFAQLDCGALLTRLIALVGPERAVEIINRVPGCGG